MTAVLRNDAFFKLWAGETVSAFGSQVTLLALPLTAILLLHAGPEQIGLLNAAVYLPFVVLTLPAGVWIDRRKRRGLLIAANAGRAVILATIPLLWHLSVLHIEALYVAALAMGALTVLFELGYQSYLPSVVEHDDLVDGNSALQASASAAEIGGPGLGGLLVQVATAPIALLVDALSFLVSAIALATIRRPEPEPKPAGPNPRLKSEIAEGLRFTFRHKVLRACALEAGTYNLFWMMLETVFLLYATRNLGMSPGAVGLVIGCGAAGSLIGSLAARRLSDRAGVGRTIAGSMVVGCAAPLLIPLASGPTPLIMAVFAASFFIGGVGTTVANIHVVTTRQTITPDHLLGRMNASYRFLAWGTVPFGAVLGGVLGGAIGLRPTLFVAGAGLLAASLWILFSPVPRMRDPADVAIGALDPPQRASLETV